MRDVRGFSVLLIHTILIGIHDIRSSVGATPKYQSTVHDTLFVFAGKGNFWSIHPACEDDFAKGDYRRRHARRRARRNALSSQQHSGFPGFAPLRHPGSVAHSHYMPYSFGSYLPSYPQSGGFVPMAYTPNVTVSTPGTGYVHQQHMSIAETGLTGSDGNLNSSGSSSGIGSPPQARSPESPFGLHAGYGVPCGAFGSSSPFERPACSTNNSRSSQPDTYMSEASLKDALVGLSALSH